MPTPPPDLLSAFPPSADALLDDLRARVDDEMLREIARADYGMDFDAHLEALRSIHDRDDVPAPMGWEPKEVLELIRWSEPDDASWQPGGTGTRGHRMRAFACAALLRAAAEPESHDYFDGENATLAQLLASALVLGPEVQEATARFLAWRVPGMGPDEERPFFAFALLFLAVLLRDGRVPDRILAQAAEWVIAEEAKEREAMSPHLPYGGEPWLLGLTFFDLRHAVWRSLAERLLREAEALHPGEARDRLEEIGLRLLGAD